MNKITVNDRVYDIIEAREYGQNVRDQRKEILFHDPSESKYYLLLSYMEVTANTPPATNLRGKNRICDLTDEQVNYWKSRNLDAEKLPYLEADKEIIMP